MRVVPRLARIERTLPHILAGGLAMVYAWVVSRTSLMPSGLQFVAPALVILSVHVLWAVWRGGWTGEIVLRRCAVTGVGLVGCILMAVIWAPMPSQAVDAGDIVAGLLTVVACVLILAVVLAVIVGAIWLVYKLIMTVFGGASDDNRRNDLGSLGVVALLLVGASLEGVPGSYRFDGSGLGSFSTDVAAPPEAVWDAMQTATSPAIAVPAILRFLPQPVEVRVDEGVALGSNRVVIMAGREGRGALHLRVVERTATRVRFETVSDHTPTGRWIAIRTITYEVVPTEGGTRLSVEVEFDRKLAPALVFGPMMRAATSMAAGVLGRDTAARAAGVAQ
ncbi:SRPBCC family protein [Jannaschia pohangensis]|uniref:Polyketide cyclase / dehydrase and lipid transport n=1 Tax=Jannaschia pohangensis TaxID=390807 RepID=A0A1I3SHR4_9RHOB|nr:SRPBCC family protein [Jannaschia pohangensis]SFJ57171.1 Polyketide cyclase / dehydrase and lipid transport [Jannaschia pohangensis]